MSSSRGGGAAWHRETVRDGRPSGVAWRDHLASELRRAASGSRDIRRARQPARAGEAPVLVHVKRPAPDPVRVVAPRYRGLSRRAH